MGRTCSVVGCSELVECAYALDSRGALCKDHLVGKTLEDFVKKK